MYLGYGLYYDLLHQLTQLWWGAIWLPGVTRLDARYSITHNIAAIHIHVLVMDKFWMIDRCHSVLRFHATQANSTPTVVTGRHITPQVSPQRVICSFDLMGFGSHINAGSLDKL